MLRVAGRVKPGPGLQEFVPLPADWSVLHGRLLEPPLLVKLVDAPRPSSPGGSVRRRRRVITMVRNKCHTVAGARMLVGC
jgi:hypothetical protein